MALRFPGLQPGQVLSYTTGNLAAGASELGIIYLGRSGRIKNFNTSAAARVQLYRTAAARAADVGRAYNTRPSAGQGVILDFQTSATALAFLEDVLFSNGDNPASSAIYLSITSIAGGPITATFNTIVQEF